MIGLGCTEIFNVRFVYIIFDSDSDKIDYVHNLFIYLPIYLPAYQRRPQKRKFPNLLSPSTIVGKTTFRARSRSRASALNNPPPFSAMTGRAHPSLIPACPSSSKNHPKT